MKSVSAVVAMSVLMMALFGCSEPIAELKIIETTEVGDGNLKVKYKIRTIDGSSCSLSVSFLRPNGVWTTTKEGSGSEGTKELTSANDWKEHTYVWEHKTDLGPGKHDGIKLRLIPYTLRKGYGDTVGPITVGEPLVAVALSTDNSIAFVDPVTNTVVFTVTVGNKPSALAQSADGLTVLVANESDDTVTVVSLKSTLSGSTIGTVTVGDAPVDIVLSSDGKTAFVANSGDNTIGVIDIETLTQTTTIPVGANPVSIALSPSENALFVANKNDDTVSIIDTKSLSVVTTIPVGDEPSAVLVTADNKYLLVACRGENTVWAFKTSNLSRPEKIINVGSQPIALAATSDSLLAFSANFGSNSISFINLESLTATDTITTSTSPTALSVSYNDAALFVACKNAGRLDKIGIATKSRTGTYSVGSNPVDVAALKR